MMTPSPRLSREEQLEIWLERKGKTSSSSSSSSQQRRKSSLNITPRSYQTPGGSLGSARRLSNKSYSSSFLPHSTASKSFVGGDTGYCPRPFVIQSGAGRSATPGLSRQEQATHGSGGSGKRPSFVTSRRRPLAVLPREGVTREQRKGRLLTSRKPHVSKLDGSGDHHDSGGKPRQMRREGDSENSLTNTQHNSVERNSSRSQMCADGHSPLSDRDIVATTMKSASLEMSPMDSCDGGQARSNDLIGLVIALNMNTVMSPLPHESGNRHETTTVESLFEEGPPVASPSAAGALDGHRSEENPSSTVDEDALDWRNAMEEEPIVRKARRRRQDSILHKAPPANSLDTPSPRLDHADSGSARLYRSDASSTKTTPLENVDAKPVSRSDADTSLVRSIVPQEVLRVDEKAVLESIPEKVHDGCLPAIADQNDELQCQIQSLRLTNKKLEGQLQIIRRSYEQRVTPFRDLFDEMRKLREVNESLRKQKHESEASVQRIVDDLKAQMMTGLSSAVGKAQALQKQLDEVREENEHLKHLLEEQRRCTDNVPSAD